MTGRGVKASSDVNRIRKAYYFYYIPYVGAVCSPFPKTLHSLTNTIASLENIF